MEMDLKILFFGCYFWSIANNQIIGPPGRKQQYSTAADYETCDSCQWTSPYGVIYDLSVPCQHQFTVWMENPKASQIQFGVCSKVECKGYDKAMGCVLVPGNKPTSSGQHLIFEPLELHQPSSGVRMILIDGEICAVNRKPRKTFINFHCDNTYNMEDTSVPGLSPSRAYEGQGEDICNYYVNFHSKYGCPKRANKYAKLSPQITAVTGCTDSDPLLSTSECSAGGDITISIHGTDFTAEGQTPLTLAVKIGEQECTSPTIVDAWTITCVLNSGTGEELPVSAILKTATSVRKKDGSEHIILEEIHVSNPSATVSYKPLIDYKRHFDSFLELGVGGLSKQINELYQRAFASRTVPPSVLEQMGIEHTKGILLHGPPGSGKTLLAKTIAKILNTEQVKLVNAPEIMSKYLGESEKNLRVHFDEAEKAWMEQGEKSDLHIIIIDEIDAICKPRGKADSSAAAAAYDSVVNQLLTKMDGLRSLHNVLVIGMTNRPELIDLALMRPGRFEIQIEIGLPDEDGRWEIFVIHTRQMKENGYLADDVNLRELAANTTQFSGAEIAGIVRLAASYALDRKYSRGSSARLLVTRKDFHAALQEFTPAYTQKEEDVLQEFLPRGYIKCGKPHDQVVDNILQLTEMLREGNTHNMESVLLYGPLGSGKSGLVGHVASLLKFALVKVITPQSLLGLSEVGKIEKLVEAFHDASKSEFGLLVLDDLHNMMEVVQVGSTTSASQTLLHTLSTLLASKVNNGNKLLILGTLWSEHENLIQSYTGKVGLQDMFATHLFVPKLKLPGALTLLSNLSIMRKGREFFRMPQQMSVSLRTMLKITDCVQHKVAANNGDLLNTPQYFMDECLSLFPHMDPVASMNI